VTNRPKQIGTAAEAAVVKVAREFGRFSAADRHVLKGGADEGDIWLLPTGQHAQVIIEVKGGHAAEQASDAQIEKWLQETDDEVRNTTLATKAYVMGFLVTKRKGVGAANAGRWWAHMRLSTLESIRSHFDNELDAVLRMTLDDALSIVENGGWR
jgi:hypothetical protein